MIDEKLWERCYAIARAARSQGKDPSDEVEIVPAADLAARVEGIVGPKGIAEAIRKCTGTRIQISFQIAEKIISGEFGHDEKGKLVEQAIRTGTAIMTAGVLVAPTEGIASIEIRDNQDGTSYLDVSYAGPIRGAGGSGAAMSVLLADFARRKAGIGEFKATETVIERYVEEVNLYDMRGARLQYKPSDEVVRHISSNCPVCINGEPTELFEVSVHRDVPGVTGNRVRGGMCLVLCEGVAQKASRVLATARKMGVDWDWMEAIIKVPKAKEKFEATPLDKFLDEVVAGRPIFAYPSRFGGFRLRYGRARNTGICSKAVHPATMIALDSFPAIGTQLKIERPDKGCIIVPCDTIEGPVVKLDDASVVQLTTTEEAIKLHDRIARILWLGDMLISLGDFTKGSKPLFPAGYCEEWWIKELEEAATKKNEKVSANIVNAPNSLTAEEAIKLSEHYEIPLHPKYTYFWKNTTGKEVKELVEWLHNAQLKYEWFKLSEIRLKCSSAKNVLEKILLPHRVEKDEIVIESNNALALARTLGVGKDIKAILETVQDDENGLDTVNKISKIMIRDKAGTWIGARMGRPEKARERLMKPAPHVLFPLGLAGGKTRNVTKAYKDAKLRDGTILVEVVRLKCRNCGHITSLKRCEKCGSNTYPERICEKCGRSSLKAVHDCGGKAVPSETRSVPIVTMFDEAVKKCGFNPPDMKGVLGMTSELKMPEPLEKGILRAKNGIFVFKDGTVRFDATNIPLTHFKPSEIGTSVERLREMGYEKDAYGNDLRNPDQLVELMMEDVIIAERAADYLLRVAQFVDDCLVKLYGLEPFYQIKDRAGLMGQLIIELSPHTSCGIVGRIIGVTKVHGWFAHPYFLAASRRDADGDENAIMLMMDGLLNFSRTFLPRSRGGTMDAPLVLMTKIDVAEVDDEVHSLDICKELPLDFYNSTLTFMNSGELKLEKVADRLGKDTIDKGLWFSRPTSSINDGVTVTRYVTLKSMREKIDAQLLLGTKIDAVDARDAAERVILSHFLPDLYGNLRSFSQQQFRCVDCNMKYRRVPLSGKCRKCGGKLLLTINKGGVEKYLKISQEIVERFDLPAYLKQRLALLEQNIKSMFEDDTSKQFNLAEYM